MFSKKKKVDAKADAKAPAAAAESQSPAAAESPEAGAPEPADSLSPEQSATGGAPGGGLLAGGLGSKAKTPSISASRLGGRPPSRPSAPAPPPAPVPEPSAKVATPAVPAVPFGGVGGVGGPGGGSSSGQNNPAATGASAAHAEAEMSRSGRMQAMDAQGVSHAGLPLQEAGPNGAAKVKNPYKPNLAFDVLLPVGMALVLCGGFGYTLKFPKDKHAIYGYSEAEKAVQVKIVTLTDPKLIEELKKMDPVKLLDSGDTAGAVAAAKAMGSKAAAYATEKALSSTAKTPPQSAKELGEEDSTVRALLASGTVLSRAGSKADKELGLTYMAKAAEIATYSKYVRLLYARELVRNHKDEDAIKQYENIISLFNDPWSLPHKELGLLYMRANRGSDAVNELTVLLKTDPNDPSIQRQLGLAMAQNGDQQAGFEVFQKGFTREGDVLSYPAAVKGLVDAHGGLVDATLADVKKQADKNPQDMKLQLDLARLDIATGKIKEARDLMENARKTQELNPEVHEVMAEVMCRQNQAQSGYDEFRSAAQNLHLQQ